MNIESVKSETKKTEQKPTDTQKKFDPDKRIDSKDNRDYSSTGTEKFNPDQRVNNNEIKNEKYLVPTAERIERAGYSDGEWSGNVGRSEFIPNSKEAKSELKQYGLSSIEYRSGNPDFSKCAEATVKITDMTSSRPKNYRQADIKCAEKWNKEKRDDRTDWTHRDVQNWRIENNYSWHERIDRKTMDLVPRNIHNECKHCGGVAECKRAEQAKNNGDGFDA